MHNTNKFFVLIVAGALTGMTTSVVAGPTKQASFAFAPIVEFVPDTTTQVIPAAINANITNLAPPKTANSNISSLRFTISPDLAILAADSGFGPVCPGAQCWVDTSTNQVLVSNISPPVQAKQTYTVKFYVASCGEATVQSVEAFSGGQFNGDIFGTNDVTTIPHPMVSCGATACDTSFQTYVYDSTGTTCTSSPNATTCVQGARGLNSDGTCPQTSVSYFVNNYLSTAKKNINFQWPVTTQSTEVFAYKINAVKTTDPTVYPTWQVSWMTFSDGSLAGKSAFIDAPECKDLAQTPPSDLPLPYVYTSLKQSVGSSAPNTAGTIKVNNSSIAPPDPNEVFVIGQERLKFVSTSGTNWNVIRGVEGSAAGSHSAGAGVVYTPLPAIPAGDVWYFDGSTYVKNVSTTTGSSNPYITGLKSHACRASAPTQSCNVDNTACTYSAWMIDGADLLGGIR